MLQAIALASLAAGAYAQQVGTLTAETHPKLTTSHCTASGCTEQTNSITLDSNWRWLHSTSGSTNCYTGNTWDATLCPDPTTCAANCALDGADYSSTYGISTTGSSLKLDFVTGSNVGSRVYLMNTADTEYEIFNMKNQEFTFDVDLSALPCGLNGALYFTEMTADGGMAEHPTNKAGAKYGTGYCDAQCPHDLKFIHGAANINNWTASANDANTGTGDLGACCQEMDVWEANSISAAYTPHPCNTTGPGATTCSGAGCSLCDQAGCDFNSYRMGNDSFYGPAKTIDTSSVFTVVTQFITADGTASGALSQIKRIYLQNGEVIQNSESDIKGVTATNSITDEFCTQQKSAFGDEDTFAFNGGLNKMGQAMENGMVLVMSLWDDYAANMLWLDSDYPTTKAATTPGVARGTCAPTSGVPSSVESASGSASVTFSNIKSGPIGSTYKA